MECWKPLIFQKMFISSKPLKLISFRFNKHFYENLVMTTKNIFFYFFRTPCIFLVKFKPFFSFGNRHLKPRATANFKKRVILHALYEYINLCIIEYLYSLQCLLLTWRKQISWTIFRRLMWIGLAELNNGLRSRILMSTVRKNILYPTFFL